MGGCISYPIKSYSKDNGQEVLAAAWVSQNKLNEPQMILSYFVLIIRSKQRIPLKLVPTVVFIASYLKSIQLEQVNPFLVSHYHQD